MFSKHFFTEWPDMANLSREKKYTTPGARSTPGVVYKQTGVFYSSLHIHHQIVHSSHFPIFSKPNPVVA